jgi:hypothetical protein
MTVTIHNSPSTRYKLLTLEGKNESWQSSVLEELTADVVS